MADKIGMQQLHRRDFLVLTGAAATASILAACGNAGGTGTPTGGPATTAASSGLATSSPDAMEPVKIDWLTVVTYEPAWVGRNVVIERFREMHPNVEVVPEIVPFDQWNIQVLNRALGGDAPPLAESGQITAELVVADTLVQTDDYIARDGVKKEDFWKPLWDFVEFDGKTWGYPSGIDVRFSFINEDLLKSIGAEPPETWDDLLALAEPARAKGVHATAFYFNPETVGYWQHAAALIASNGGAIVRVNDDGTASATANSPEVIETVQFIKQLHDTQAIPPTNLTDVFDAVDASFINGEIVLHVTGNWNVPRFDLEKEQGKMAFTPLLAPVPKNTVDASAAGGMSSYIFKTASNPDLVWEFLRFFDTDENLNEGWSHAYPGIRKGLTVPYYADDPRNEFIATVLDVSSLPVPPVAGWLETLPTAFRNITRAVSGQATPEEAMTTANEEIQALLDAGHNKLVAG